MNTTIFAFDQAYCLGDIAMHPPAPRSLCHAALLVLAGISPPRPRALPDTPITALADASNYRF
ncbi:MAG: hypothetical protein LBU72_08900 [Burkholderiaceae bacterium]|jgi:hypothetical protein|nr:hypothetical protein [Burkholderiaceae bacterium]